MTPLEFTSDTSECTRTGERTLLRLVLCGIVCERVSHGLSVPFGSALSTLTLAPLQVVLHPHVPALPVHCHRCPTEPADCPDE